MDALEGVAEDLVHRSSKARRVSAAVRSGAAQPEADGPSAKRVVFRPPKRVSTSATSAEGESTRVPVSKS